VCWLASVQCTHRLNARSIVACLVAANIVWSGVGIVRSSVSGLMIDLAIEDQNKLQKALEPYTESGVQYHALRTRNQRGVSLLSLHLLVPRRWTVQRGHRY